MQKEVVKLSDMVSEIKGVKGITKKSIEMVMKALPKALKAALLSGRALNFTGFLQFGQRVAKDRIVKSRLNGEELHMPAHKRFKPTFYKEVKDFFNN